MAGVDSLLKMLRENDADELRIGTDSAPRMSKRGSPVRLSIPPTSDAVLRILLGDLLSADAELALRGIGKVEAAHRTQTGERYSVSLQRRGEPLLTGPLLVDAVFRTASGAQGPLTTAVTMPVIAAVAAPAAPTAAAASSPLTGSLAALLRRAVSARASDLHLFSGEPPSLRIDGSLSVLRDEPAVSVESLLANEVSEEGWRQVVSGRSIDQLIDGGLDGRFRLNVYRAAGRAAAAIRVLPRRAPTLTELQMPVPLEDCVSAPHGLVIVCGPTGSGKSATLAALAETALAISARRGKARLLITLEDPVEYVIPAHDGGLVRQRQIGNDVRDFPSGLRDSLREDPDILLIGEMRDAETIALAITAAETGHLVLTSLHSRSAASSIERIVDTYSEGRQHQVRLQLADSLRAVISQRLVRSNAGGRVPAVEILRGSSSVSSLIREGKTAHLVTAMQSGRKEGMIPLERCLADMVKARQIDRDEAMAAANDVATLTSYLGL